MPRSYRYLHYDVFTDHLFGGNQLAVFLDGRGLSTETMQAIAKEMNFSESTFVLPAAQPDTDARMRIFTPGEELPMAGHPTIGSTFALARSGAIEAGRDRFVFGLGIGPVPVALTWRGADLSFAWMTQPNPTFGEPIAKPSAAAAALGLSVDSASLQRADFDRFREETKTEAHGIFLFSTQSGKDKATVYSRMFAPDLGVGEDPATGSASGPLGCYLVRHNVVPLEKAGAMLSLQGAKMGRPSHVHIAIEGAGEKITSVRVGGEAVLAGEGTLYVG